MILESVVWHNVAIMRYASFDACSPRVLPCRKLSRTGLPVACKAASPLLWLDLYAACFHPSASSGNILTCYDVATEKIDWKKRISVAAFHISIVIPLPAWLVLPSGLELRSDQYTFLPMDDRLMLLRSIYESTCWCRDGPPSSGGA